MAIPAISVTKRSSAEREGVRSSKEAFAMRCVTILLTARRNRPPVQSCPLPLSTRATSSQLCTGRIRCTVGIH
jgi:hypothetical protein